MTEQKNKDLGLKCAAVAHHLILGGMRSGKSEFAEKIIENSGCDPIYMATGQAFDKEMAQRIKIHQARRGAQWRCIESPLDVARELEKVNKPQQIILLDCLTMWLSNMMSAEKNIVQETEQLISQLSVMRCSIILVSNEVGLGIIPDNALARKFGDAQGILNQKIGQVCAEVTFVAAGFPMRLKG